MHSCRWRWQTVLYYLVFCFRMKEGGCVPQSNKSFSDPPSFYNGFISAKGFPISNHWPGLPHHHPWDNTIQSSEQCCASLTIYFRHVEASLGIVLAPDRKALDRPLLVRSGRSGQQMMMMMLLLLLTIWWVIRLVIHSIFSPRVSVVLCPISLISLFQFVLRSYPNPSWLHVCLSHRLRIVTGCCCFCCGLWGYHSESDTRWAK